MKIMLNLFFDSAGKDVFIFEWMNGRKGDVTSDGSFRAQQKPPFVTSNNAIPYHTLYYHTIPCITIPFLVLPYHSLYYHTILFNTMQNSPPCNLRPPNIVTSNSSNQERGDGTNLERIQMTKVPKHKIKELRYPKTIQRGPQVIFVQPAYKWKPM